MKSWIILSLLAACVTQHNVRTTNIKRMSKMRVTIYEVKCLAWSAIFVYIMFLHNKSRWRLLWNHSLYKVKEHLLHIRIVLFFSYENLWTTTRNRFTGYPWLFSRQACNSLRTSFPRLASVEATGCVWMLALLSYIKRKTAVNKLEGSSIWRLRFNHRSRSYNHINRHSSFSITYTQCTILYTVDDIMCFTPAIGCS